MGFIFQPTVDGGPENHDIIHDSDDKLMLAYGKYPDEDLWSCVSTDFGETWGDEFELADGFGGGEAPAFAPHPSIIRNTISKHVVFERWVAGNFDLAYMAMDDLMLSDTPEATAYNSAPHLVRDLFNGNLHLVYQSQNRVHYSFSNDNGQTWAPYHITEDPLTGQKEYGRNPSVGLNPGFFACDPCLVFIDSENQVKYRYRDIGGEWQDFTSLPYVGLEPGPSALATYGGDVFVVFSVMNWLGSEDYVSAVLFYQFYMDAGESPEPVILDQANDGRLYNSNVSITIDGNGDPHVAWSKKLAPDRPEDIFYRWRDNGNWDPSLDQDPFEVSRQADAPSIFPHIDDYEIYRRRKHILRNRWEAKSEYSHEYATCEYPVNAAVDFSVWCETPVSQSDIRYRSDTYGWGWVSQAQENEYYCHSQLQRDWYPWDLYTIFTKGNEIPYRIVGVHQQFGGDERGSESPLYQVETGKEPASVFCLQRDRAIDYGNYLVDYASQELIYDLCFLETIFPFHKIRGTIYFEGSADKTHEILVNGEKETTIVAKPDQAYDFEILIPRELYQVTPRVTVSIKNPADDGAYLSGLKVFRLLDGRSGGGPQSAGSRALANSVSLAASPNPFGDRLTIRLSYSSPLDRDAELRIYDVAGRLIKQYRGLDSQSELIWLGDDDNGKRLSNGVYFLRLESGNETLTVKAVMVK